MASIFTGKFIVREGDYTSCYSNYYDTSYYKENSQAFSLTLVDDRKVWSTASGCPIGQYYIDVFKKVMRIFDAHVKGNSSLQVITDEEVNFLKDYMVNHSLSTPEEAIEMFFNEIVMPVGFPNIFQETLNNITFRMPKLIDVNDRMYDSNNQTVIASPQLGDFMWAYWSQLNPYQRFILEARYGLISLLRAIYSGVNRSTVSEFIYPVYNFQSAGYSNSYQGYPQTSMLGMSSFGRLKMFTDRLIHICYALDNPDEYMMSPDFIKIVQEKYPDTGNLIQKMRETYFIMQSYTPYKKEIFFNLFSNTSVSGLIAQWYGARYFAYGVDRPVNDPNIINNIARQVFTAIPALISLIPVLRPVGLAIGVVFDYAFSTVDKAQAITKMEAETLLVQDVTNVLESFVELKITGEAYNKILPMGTISPTDEGAVRNNENNTLKILVPIGIIVMMILNE